MNKLILLFIGVLALIMMTFVIFSAQSEENISAKAIKETSNEQESSQQPNEQETTQNSYPSSDSSASSNSPSSSSQSQASSSSQSQNSNCQMIQISYALRDFIKGSTCSLRVENLDSNIQGKFAIDFIFFLENNENNIINIITKENIVSPNSIVQFEATHLSENPNENISCSFKTSLIPTKEVC